MGKLKTKYPILIEIDFMLFLQTSQLLRQSYIIELQSGHLQFDLVKRSFEEFLNNNQIGYETYMFYQSPQSDKQELIHADWSLSISEIEDHNRYIIIKIKSHTQHLKDLIYEQLGQVFERLGKIQERISTSQIKQQIEIKSPLMYPTLHHGNSISQVSIPNDKDLDIGILFSEPIFNQKQNREANMPVNFRSELQRLYSSLNNSYKPEITVECQIATKQHLKHLIGYKRPKILHIICHGSKDGELQFQDDSKFSIGALCLISSEKIRQILMAKKQFMPSLVFINSCHSQIIGKIFYEAGAKYCIMIDSQDKIDDEAAQIFSENFYRNIFRGEKVGIAFKEAQDTVKIKHNSSGCCCHHTARQKHKPNCRWLELSQTLGEQQAHKIYHVPSQKCICEMRNINQHDLNCEWAQFTLFHINNDFRILDNGVVRFPKKISQLPKYLPSEKKKQMLLICCCFNFQDEGKSQNRLDGKDIRIPHSESNKFKMLPVDIDNTQAIYELQKNISFRTQIIDYSAPELTQYYEKVQNSSVMGRQKQLYQFMKTIRDNQLNFFFLYGHPGVGKTTFAIKASTYLIERRVFQIYFFIDLYGIKDRDMFRNKFNQVTKFGFPLNKSNLIEVRAKPMIIVLDNVDEFFLSSVQEFQDQIQNLKKQFIHTKFIVTCKQKNISVLQNEPIFMNNHTLVKQLKALDQNTATKALFFKIRNYLDISITFFDIRQIVSKKPELLIPKVIQNLSHSFSNIKGKLKLDALKLKVNELGQGDLAFNKLVEQNLNILKQRCKESYDMLIFISQFSQGIDKNDFIILGTYDRSQARNDNVDAAIIDIPIDKNWKKRLAIMFEKYKETSNQNIKNDSESQTADSFARQGSPVSHGLSFQRRQTSIELHQNSNSQTSDQMFEGQSYFLEQISKNRFIVKRFIRDFIWNKDKSDQNFYMKHIFVAYTAVMLDIYLSFLVNEKYVHEELLQYSDISQTGIFKFKDNSYKRTVLTESVRYVEDYNSKFQRILKLQPALKQKIKNSDPSVFIMNHKLDFLHIYGYDWSKIYTYLLQYRKKQASILINYLQKLIILIPTAMKVANMQENLIKYSIRQSIQLLAQIRRYSKPTHTLLLTLKLKLMKAASQIQKGQEIFLPNTQFQRDFHKTDLEEIDAQLLKAIQKQFNYQIQILQMYAQYKKIKQYSKISESSMKISDRLLQTIKKLDEWNNDSFELEVQCQILVAKRQLIQAMIYLKILEASAKYQANVKISNFKTTSNLTSYVKNAHAAAKIFLQNRMVKLALRAKLLGVSINWQQLKLRTKPKQFSRELERERAILRECQQMYEDKRNNLIGLTIFDSLIKRIRKEMKDRMWEDSSNNLVMLKAVPLSNKNYPLLQNIVRKKQKYRKQLQSSFQKAEIDLSIKFEVLTAQKLEQETKRQSTILLLSTNFRKLGDRVFLICEDFDLKEKSIEINAEFYQKYPLYNSKLIILMGANATEGFQKISNLFPKGPSIVAITSSFTEEIDEFEQFNFQEYFTKNSSGDLKKMIDHNTKVEEAQLQFTKNFIKALINTKYYQRGIKDIYNELWSQNLENIKNFKVQIRECSKQIVMFNKGSFKDLSPGYRKSHNIDMDFKKTPICIYRKWKEINQIFREFSSKKQTKYIQICGSNGVGKTTFIQQISRMCIERGMFESGVYIINGKQVEQKHLSDFQAYIMKSSQNSNMFTLQSFNKYANSNFLLFIDDFHLIKSRSNGRYHIFLRKLLQKKVNVVFVTHDNFVIKDLMPSIQIKVIRIDKLTEVDLDILAYNTFRSDNSAALQQYEAEKKKIKMTCVQINKIYNKYSQAKYNNYLRAPMPDQHMRKLISNKN